MGLAVSIMGFTAAKLTDTVSLSTNSIRTNEEIVRGVAFQFIYAILFIGLYFFPCLFLFHFANKMKKALAANDQVTLNASFQNLKKFFRFIGILTIIILAVYAFSVLFKLIKFGLDR